MTGETAVQYSAVGMQCSTVSVVPLAVAAAAAAAAAALRHWRGNAGSRWQPGPARRANTHWLLPMLPLKCLSLHCHAPACLQALQRAAQLGLLQARRCHGQRQRRPAGHQGAAGWRAALLPACPWLEGWLAVCLPKLLPACLPACLPAACSNSCLPACWLANLLPARRWAPRRSVRRRSGGQQRSPTGLCSSSASSNPTTAQVRMALLAAGCGCWLVRVHNAEQSRALPCQARPACFPAARSLAPDRLLSGRLLSTACAAAKCVLSLTPHWLQWRCCKWAS